jgi:hypothetical protein
MDTPEMKNFKAQFLSSVFEKLSPLLTPPSSLRTEQSSMGPNAWKKEYETITEGNSKCRLRGKLPNAILFL